MNTNENNRTNALEDIIELGLATVETQGGGAIGEVNGDSLGSAISEE